MFILGVDPGRSGAFCFRDLEGKSIELFQLPYLESEPDIAETRDLIRSLGDRVATFDMKWKVFLEKAQSMPGNAGQAMLRYGRGSGIIEGILSAYHIPYELVRPVTWTKEVCSGVGDYVNAKHKSSLVARRLFPMINFKRTERCKNDDEGYIDACLLAEFGARKERGSLTTKLS